MPVKKSKTKTIAKSNKSKSASYSGRGSRKEKFDKLLIRTGGATFTYEVIAGLLKKLKPYVGLDFLPERYLVPLAALVAHRMGWIKVKDLDLISLVFAFNSLFKEVGLDFAGFGQQRQMAQYHRTPAQTAAAIRAAQGHGTNYGARYIPPAAAQYKGREMPKAALSYGKYDSAGY